MPNLTEVPLATCTTTSRLVYVSTNFTHPGLGSLSYSTSWILPGFLIRWQVLVCPSLGLSTDV